MAFWTMYPRKVGKLAAQRKFASICRTEATRDEILAALKAQSAAFAGKDPQYIPHPSTWLNQGRWMDEATVRPTAAPLFDPRDEPIDNGIDVSEIESRAFQESLRPDGTWDEKRYDELVRQYAAGNGPRTQNLIAS